MIDIVKESHYHWNPEVYHTSSSSQAKWAGELLSKTILLGNERILDLGCGEGKITMQLANLVPKGMVVGLDASPEMIQFARETYPSTRLIGRDLPALSN